MAQINADDAGAIHTIRLAAVRVDASIRSELMI